MKAWISLLAVLMIATAARFVPAPPFADEKVYAIGDVIMDFKLKNVDGRPVSLSDYKNGKGVIIVFTTNHCPFSKAYEERMIALDHKYAPLSFPLIAIQPNDPGAYSEDSFENMKIRAQEKNYSFPYLSDETQSVAHAFGATRTPEVFVLKRTGDRFTMEYTGMIDDSPQVAAVVKRRFVEEAVNNLLAGRPVVTTNTKAIGCAIKWKSM
ncbi:thioredoxin family protein [Larkinella terrae]|uniref:Redoxin domain-containing protein n=1 Tax=Larkinella terrae TaxID=2025311 RepID=A0A7K0EWM5_9BACT|nr:redoxin domain-containing protein [Larkinella terrae]MRS65801.1 redoxin domain-containing protein [Larkinella terrae]